MTNRAFERLSFRTCLLASVMAITLTGCSYWPFGGDDDSARRARYEPVDDSLGNEERGSAPVNQPPSAYRAGFDSRTEVRDDAPNQHIVVKGDTLWDISSLFLKDPWMWPEIWYVNPQIENPHLIYPGDLIRLVWVDGRPQLRLERGAGLDRLSPRIRVQDLDEAIPTVPYDVIAAFISRPTVLTKEQVSNLPYILAIRESHLVAGSAFSVYVRGIDDPPDTRFTVVHPGDKLYDPDNGELLGYEGEYVGTGRITRSGDPATLFLTETDREGSIGDRLLLEQPELPVSFTPRPPRHNVEGRIISVIGGVALIGQYQIVVLNRGAIDGLEPGHVLTVWQTGEVVRDRYASSGVLGLNFLGDKVRLPEEKAGRLMIFRTLDKISYGLITRATSEINVLDTVRTPE